MLKKEINYDEDGDDDDVEMAAEHEQIEDEEDDEGVEVDRERNIVRVKPRLAHVPDVNFDEGEEEGKKHWNFHFIYSVGEWC